MSALDSFAEGLLAPTRRIRRVIRRATLGPMLVRGGVFLATLVALVTAYPAQVILGRGLVPLLVVAAAPAVMPRGRSGTVAALVAVAGWLLNTILYGAPVTFWRLVALGGALYLGHSLTALAAVLPYDSIVNAEVLVRWLSRALLVVFASAILALVLLVVAALAGGTPLLSASLVGLGVAVGLAALLVRPLRRG
jgi:glycosyltransferase involved in cell wall biosynthesis